jgi:SAM-dependent methyltransferase
MKKLLNAGCGTHYAKGWVNTDVWDEDPATTPDIKVEAGEPYPFEDDTFDAVYLGHVIEHIAWSLVPGFLSDMCRIAKPNAPILIVGPDVYRTIVRWSQGQEPWHMVESTLEHQDGNFQPDREHEQWEAAAHHWNCHEARVIKLLEQCGLSAESYTERIPSAPDGKAWYDPRVNLTWPVVGYHYWQFAVLTHAPVPSTQPTLEMTLASDVPSIRIR